MNAVAPASCSEGLDLLRRRPIVWDMHSCMPLRPGDREFLPQLRRFRASGVDVASLNIGFATLSLEEHVRTLAWFRTWIRAHPDLCRLVGSLAEIEQAKRDGVLGVFFDVEGMGVLDKGDNGVIEMLFDLGVRWMLIAYNRATAVGSGCYDPEDGGLTDFGRSVLAEMRRVGMTVCCSHTGERTALEVCAEAGAPVILSHSNAKSVWNHTRNVSDALIDAVAETGGVVGVNGIGLFLGDNDISTEAVVRHVDHMVQRVGVEHVGFGFDYVFDIRELEDYLVSMRETFPDDPTYSQPFRCIGPEQMPEIAQALSKRGYGEADLDALWGGNWRRVAERTWGPRS